VEKQHVSGLARWVSLAVIGALGAGTAACGASAPTAPARTAEDTPQAFSDARVLPTTASDTNIVAVTLRELQADTVVRRERIEVDCVNGVLTLQGEVAVPLAKLRAVEIAELGKGVRAVVDRLVLAAHPQPDYELEFLAASALAHDHVTYGEPIAAKGSAGTIRLTGNVDSNATRAIAENDVLAIPGVLSVENDLAVVPGPRSDGRLLGEVTRVMNDDPWIDDARVHIEVGQQVVRLSGNVNSAAERARAERDAHACSPEGVDVTALRIDPIADGTLRGQPAVPRTDDDLTRAFFDAVRRDPRVRPFVPGIQVRDRVAVITGQAPNRDAALAVADDARNVVGMADTHIELDALAMSASDDDGAVRAGARGVIDRDPRLSVLRLSVDVLHGRVTVSGEVPSEVDRRRALAAVASVPGARGVDDEIRVDRPTLPHPKRPPTGVTSLQRPE
jgi:osmotically-inducible protein OsmY